MQPIRNHPLPTLLFRAAAAAALSLGLIACDGSDQCKPLADHITEIHKKAQETAPSEKSLAKSAKETTDACNKKPPPQASIDCAMKAETVEALAACDPAEEAAAEEPK